MAAGRDCATGFTTVLAAGFAAPAWQDQPAVNMGPATPVVSWLIEQALPYNANLLDDANGDGVSLLLAYALDLDPQPRDHHRGRG